MTPGLLVILAIVLVTPAGVSPCPTNCSCHRGYTNCRQASLTSLPTNVTNDTTVFDVSFNNISFVKNYDLVELPHLNLILLNNNKIFLLEPYIFHRTRRLHYLYLNNNRIVVINVSMFQFSKNLRYLYLQNNVIRYIHPQLFEHNPELVILDISGNNILKLQPNTFDSNPILSWVNIRDNPLALSLGWTTLFGDCFNVLDIEFCDSSNPSISAFQKIPSLESLGTEHSTALSLDEFTSLQNVPGLHSSEIEYLKFKMFHRLYSLSYGSINNMKIDEDFNVISMTGGNVLCYCEHYGFWYWCSEQSQTTCKGVKTKTEIYNFLGCYIQRYNATIVPGSKSGNKTSNRGRMKRLFGSFYRPVNWKTIRNTLLYASVPFIIIMLVIGVKIVKTVRKRRSKIESTNSSYYLQVNTSDRV
jgi:Leucine-rich repeat (LRR) protein